MKFTTRVKNAVGVFSKNDNTEVAKNSNSPLSREFFRSGSKNKPLLQDWSQVEMSDQDMYTGYSYAAIKKRANRASALGKKFLYTEASKEVMAKAKEAKNETEIEHPYLTLIKESTEFTRRKFWHDISTYLDLEGVYYLMAVRAVAEKKDAKEGELDVKVGAIQKLVMLNPYNVRRVVKKSDGTVGAYIESKNGRYREIPKEMIIEVRLLNPFNNDEAYSMTDAAKESQFTMKQAGDYTRHSIKGNINAPGAITTDVELDDNIFDNFVARIRNHSKGEPLYGNGAGSISYTSMQVDLDKAALDKINEIHRSILFAVSGTSKTTLGIEESGTTRDTSQVQKDNFTEDAVMPQIEDIIDALNLDYRKYYNEDWQKNKYEIILDNPLESDREAELKDIEIREAELNLRQSLIELGYETELAAKYAHGDISLEELGEPTLEVAMTDAQIMVAAAAELGIQLPNPQDPLAPAVEQEEAENKLDKAENAGYNPYRDKEGKFADGPPSYVPAGTNQQKIAEAKKKLSAESGKKNKPTTKKVDKGDKSEPNGLVSEKEAKEFTKNSKYKKVVLHGTSAAAAEGIAQSGFRTDLKGVGRQYGDGVYLTPMMDSAREYAKMADNAKGKILTSRVNLTNPYIDGKTGDFAKGAFEFGKKQGIIKKSSQGIDDSPIKDWNKATASYANSLMEKHDGVIIKGYFDDLVIVKDPASIKTYKVEGLK